MARDSATPVTGNGRPRWGHRDWCHRFRLVSLCQVSPLGPPASCAVIRPGPFQHLTIQKKKDGKNSNAQRLRISMGTPVPPFDSLAPFNDIAERSDFLFHHAPYKEHKYEPRIKGSLKPCRSNGEEPAPCPANGPGISKYDVEHIQLLSSI